MTVTGRLDCSQSDPTDAGRQEPEWASRATTDAAAGTPHVARQKDERVRTFLPSLAEYNKNPPRVGDVDQ